LSCNAYPTAAKHNNHVALQAHILSIPFDFGAQFSAEDAVCLLLSPCSFFSRFFFLPSPPPPLPPSRTLTAFSLLLQTLKERCLVKRRRRIISFSAVCVWVIVCDERGAFAPISLLCSSSNDEGSLLSLVLLPQEAALGLGEGAHSIRHRVCGDHVGAAAFRDEIVFKILITFLTKIMWQIMI
jgi:hypothetical protein